MRAGEQRDWKRAGQRQHRVVLQEGVPVIDALGGRSQTWPSFAEDWAAIDSLPLVVSETEATILFQVTLKYRADVAEKHAAGTQLRVVGGGVTLKLLDLINPEQMNVALVLHCARA